MEKKPSPAAVHPASTKQATDQPLATTERDLKIDIPGESTVDTRSGEIQVISLPYKP